jgi:hypothetical protein
MVAKLDGHLTVLHQEFLVFTVMDTLRYTLGFLGRADFAVGELMLFDFFVLSFKCIRQPRAKRAKCSSQESWPF